jgi:hypothetical protein
MPITFKIWPLRSVEVGSTFGVIFSMKLLLRRNLPRQVWSIGGDLNREALVNQWLPTRLGDGTVTVAVENLVSPFTGQKIEGLAIPARWLRGTALPDESVNAVGGQLHIGTQNFAYDRLGTRQLKVQ